MLFSQIHFLCIHYIAFSAANDIEPQSILLSELPSALYPASHLSSIPALRTKNKDQ